MVSDQVYEDFFHLGLGKLLICRKILPKGDSFLKNNSKISVFTVS